MEHGRDEEAEERLRDIILDGGDVMSCFLNDNDGLEEQGEEAATVIEEWRRKDMIMMAPVTQCWCKKEPMVTAPVTQCWCKKEPVVTATVTEQSPAR